MNSNLPSQIESLLFVSSKPIDIKLLAKLTNNTESEVQEAIRDLQNLRKNSGLIILENNGACQLATNPENAGLVTNFLNSELREKLSEASIEVLAIVAYRQPISRSEIEAIRGVNSQYSLRHLLMRGLIEKISNPNDARGTLYQLTTEFLQHMGIGSVTDLPDFETLANQVKLPDIPGHTENTHEPSPAPTPVLTPNPITTPTSPTLAVLNNEEITPKNNPSISESNNQEPVAVKPYTLKPPIPPKIEIKNTSSPTLPG